MTEGAPYLSVVVAARNDDHGGNLLGRMRIFIQGWITQVRRHGLSSEVIIVEWNPPLDRPRLREVLQWPDDFGPCEIRFIEVPWELHRRYQHAEALPLYQMIAKNAGIRRARGRFVLATNIDILFSDELAAFLARRCLDADRMYRVDRYDAMSEVPANASLDEQLDYCRTHLLRINAREGTFPVTPDGRRTLEKTDIAAADSGVTFGRGWYPVERYVDGESFRWIGEEAEMMVQLPRRLRTLCLDLAPGPGMGDQPMELQVYDGTETVLTAGVHRRSELRICFSRFDSDERNLRFVVAGGGQPVGLDPRALNCQVYSVAWEGAPLKHQAIVARAVPTGWRRRLIRTWRLIQALVDRLATGGPLVTLTIPVARPVRRAAAFYVGWGGFTGMAESSVAALLRLLGIRARWITRRKPEAMVVARPQIANLHTNACGDFTLASRQRWLDLRGYPEFDLYSMNIDSLGCYALHHGGAVEEVLHDPMRIYHIEHGSGSGWTPEGQAALFERLAAKGVPHLPWSEVAAWAAQMRRLECPMIFNQENWGLAEFDLPETRVEPKSRAGPVQRAAR